VLTRRCVILIVLLSVFALANVAQAGNQPGSAGSSSNAATVGNCPMFPADNPWNRDISNDPVDPMSSTYIATLNSGSSQHLNFGFGLWPEYGLPFNVVPGTQPKVPIQFTLYGNQSDPGPYPIPVGALVEGIGKVASDKHVIVVDKDNCLLYELYDANYIGPGWSAASGAIFNLRSNQLRPEGWTSADAAGLPIFPGLVRREEVMTGAITHALRMSVGAGQTQKPYRYPARHWHATTIATHLTQMGMRIRLKASYDISGYPGSAKIILQALKKYGMFIADEGGPWTVSGTSDAAWDRANLETLKNVPGSAFEVVLPNYGSPTSPTKTPAPSATRTPMPTATKIPPTMTPVPVIKTNTPSASPALKIQYRTLVTTLSTNQLGPYVNIVNNSSSAVPLSQLKIRYYFTRDTAQYLVFHCDWAQVGCANVIGKFVQVSPAVTNADFYIEVGFSTSAGSLAAYSQSGDIQMRVNKTDWSMFNQSNDQSFDRTRTTYADFSRIALYRNGVLIWGSLPRISSPAEADGKPTATPASFE
jgi:Cellulose binding domain